MITSPPSDSIACCYSSMTGPANSIIWCERFMTPSIERWVSTSPLFTQTVALGDSYTRLWNTKNVWVRPSPPDPHIEGLWKRNSQNEKNGNKEKCEESGDH